VRPFLALLLASAAMAAASASHASAPLLHARPKAAAATLKMGESFVANGAVAYRPRSASRGPFPLIVLLHGAMGYPPHFLQSIEPEASRRGAILLAPRSLGRTWDILINAAAGRDPWSGQDTQRLDEALSDLFSRADIDRSRIVLLGFSDGASYALSLGPANPQLFSAVVALSPGSAVAPDRIDPAQRLFVAHGRSDSILPFANTDRQLVPALRQRGASVTFRPFAGDHEINRKVLGEALDFALGLQARPQPPTSTPK
jgi:phospholipase/carboxylesterase